jgi:hypothetical protein
MFVTGYKTDIWLVKTVGALLIPIALTLASFLLIRGNLMQAILLGSTTAIAFAIIDFYYALNDVVHDIYMADGILQVIFLISWMIIFAEQKQNKKSQTQI